MNSIPKQGFRGLKENWKYDLKARFTVSLLTLPLCLGIALSSGVSPVAGIITAIIGGFKLTVNSKLIKLTNIESQDAKQITKKLFQKGY
jgi:MFS superfamily sulfate permease-like transporter